MDGTTVAAWAVATAALAAFALTAFMFWHGRWLFLVAGRSAHAEEAAADEGADGSGGVRKLARRMVVVLLVGCALVATLLLFEGAKLADNDPLASAGAMANNVAFVALLAGMAWFFVVQRPDRGKDESSTKESRVAARARTARLDHLPLATIVFAVAFIAVVALVGILFAGR